ncbi:nucleolar protein [Sporothrix bragantina]|uniref:Nucleolar protein n=1 Tax=Sporothrix bragantina TaxID=671064 RepID=A0ABP0APD0_9PEZI
MVKDKKTKASATEVAPRKSSRISEQVVKRKAAEESSPVAVKKRKAPEEPVTEKKAKTEKKPAPAKQTKKKAAEPVDEEEDKENETVAVEDDATTKALVEEIDGGDEDDKTAQGGASLFQRGQDVGKAPAAAVKKAAEAKAAKSKNTNGSAADGKLTEKNGAVVPVAATSTDANGVEFGGVVYVGRIPHGFFEHEMRSYFSQFGDIRRLRLSRNRKTGASKHYAFIEFSDREVADIVAKTMDNYLLFGHLLRCSVVSPDRIPANLFKGANRRFKAVPWNRMAGRKLAQPKPESEWTDKISRETKKRAERAALLESKLGYSFAAPELKTTDTVEAPAAPEEKDKEEKEEAEAPKQLEEAAPAEDPVVAISTAPNKGKKGKAKKVAA